MNTVNQIAGFIQMGLTHQALIAQGFDPVDIQSAHTYLAAQNGINSALNQNQGTTNVPANASVTSGVQTLNQNIESAVTKHLSGLKIAVYDMYKILFLSLLGAIIVFVLLWSPWNDKGMDVKALIPASAPVAASASSTSTTLVTQAYVDMSKDLAIAKSDASAKQQLIECLSQTGLCAVKK